MEAHDALVRAKVANRRVTHGQMILCRRDLGAEVTCDLLVAGRLQVDAVERQAVETTEQLNALTVHALLHVKVGLLGLAPAAGNNPLVRRLKSVHTHAGTKLLRLTIELNRVGDVLRRHRFTTELALRHCQLIGGAERCKATVAAYSVYLLCNFDLMLGGLDLIANRALEHCLGSHSGGLFCRFGRRAGAYNLYIIVGILCVESFAAVGGAE